MNRLSASRKYIYNHFNKKLEGFSYTKNTRQYSKAPELPLIKLLHSIYIADTALKTG